MRAVVQRVSSASVSVDNEVVGAIGAGVLVLVGVEQRDTVADVKYLANKVVGLRIFPDREDKMNLSLVDFEGEILAVSQFTLLGDVRKGRRPSFVSAANPEQGKDLYAELVSEFKATGLKVATGIFQADMKVALVNDGPVTILIDSKKLF